MTVPFWDAILGTTRKITINRQEQCPTCHGTGEGVAQKEQTCPECHGTGEVKQAVGNMNAGRKRGLSWKALRCRFFGAPGTKPGASRPPAAYVTRVLSALTSR